MKLDICLDLVVLLLFSIGGEASNQIHKPAVQHGSVSLMYSPSHKMGTIQSVSWKYDRDGERMTILDTTEKPYNIYDSKFRDRLVMSDDLFTLTIKNLTMVDSGVYIIDVTDRNGRSEYSSFNVTVYEPIANPSIRPEVKEKTTDGCNVTLHCSAPSYTSDISYTWIYRHQGSEYKPYSNGSSIHILVPPDHQDMELLCIVQNPADQKNVSVQVQQNLCKLSDNPSDSRRHLSIIISVVMVMIILLIVIMIFIWKKHKIPEVKEKSNRELIYSEVKTTRPRENHQVIQMDNDQYMGMPSTRKTKAETVYTTLQHPPPKHT